MYEKFRINEWWPGTNTEQAKAAKKDYEILTKGCQAVSGRCALASGIKDPQLLAVVARAVFEAEKMEEKQSTDYKNREDKWTDARTQRVQKAREGRLENADVELESIMNGAFLMSAEQLSKGRVTRRDDLNKMIAACSAADIRTQRSVTGEARRKGSADGSSSSLSADSSQFFTAHSPQYPRIDNPIPAPAHLTGVVLDCDDVRVRCLTDNDSVAYAGLLSDPRSFPQSRTEPGLTPAHARDRIQQFGAEGHQYGRFIFVLERVADGRLCGIASINVQQLMAIDEFFMSSNHPADKVLMADFHVQVDQTMEFPTFSFPGMVPEVHNAHNEYLYHEARVMLATRVICALLEFSRLYLGCRLFRTECSPHDTVYDRAMSNLILHRYRALEPLSYNSNCEASVWKFDFSCWEIARDTLRRRNQWGFDAQRFLASPRVETCRQRPHQYHALCEPEKTWNPSAEMLREILLPIHGPGNSRDQAGQPLGGHIDFDSHSLLGHSESSESLTLSTCSSSTNPSDALSGLTPLDDVPPDELDYYIKDIGHAPSIFKGYQKGLEWRAKVSNTAAKIEEKRRARKQQSGQANQQAHAAPSTKTALVAQSSAQAAQGMRPLAPAPPTWGPAAPPANCQQQRPRGGMVAQILAQGRGGRVMRPRAASGRSRTDPRADAILKPQHPVDKGKRPAGSSWHTQPKKPSPLSQVSSACEAPESPAQASQLMPAQATMSQPPRQMPLSRTGGAFTPVPVENNDDDIDIDAASNVAEPDTGEWLLPPYYQNPVQSPQATSVARGRAMAPAQPSGITIAQYQARRKAWPQTSGSSSVKQQPQAPGSTATQNGARPLPEAMEPTVTSPRSVSPSASSNQSRDSLSISPTLSHTDRICWSPESPSADQYQPWQVSQRSTSSSDVIAEDVMSMEGVEPTSQQPLPQVADNSAHSHADVARVDSNMDYTMVDVSVTMHLPVPPTETRDSMSSVANAMDNAMMDVSVSMPPPATPAEVHGLTSTHQEQTARPSVTVPSQNPGQIAAPSPIVQTTQQPVEVQKPPVEQRPPLLGHNALGIVHQPQPIRAQPASLLLPSEPVSHHNSLSDCPNLTMTSIVAFVDEVALAAKAQQTSIGTTRAHESGCGRGMLSKRGPKPKQPRPGAQQSRRGRPQTGERQVPPRSDATFTVARQEQWSAQYSSSYARQGVLHTPTSAGVQANTQPGTSVANYVPKTSASYTLDHVYPTSSSSQHSTSQQQETLTNAPAQTSHTGLAHPHAVHHYANNSSAAPARTQTTPTPQSYAAAHYSSPPQRRTTPTQQSYAAANFKSPPQAQTTLMSPPAPVYTSPPQAPTTVISQPCASTSYTSPYASQSSGPVGYNSHPQTQVVSAQPSQHSPAHPVSHGIYNASDYEMVTSDFDQNHARYQQAMYQQGSPRHVQPQQNSPQAKSSPKASEPKCRPWEV